MSNNNNNNEAPPPPAADDHGTTRLPTAIAPPIPPQLIVDEEDDAALKKIAIDAKNRQAAGQPSGTRGAESGTDRLSELSAPLPPQFVADQDDDAALHKLATNEGDELKKTSIYHKSNGEGVIEDGEEGDRLSFNSRQTLISDTEPRPPRVSFGNSNQQQQPPTIRPPPRSMRNPVPVNNTAANEDDEDTTPSSVQFYAVEATLVDDTARRESVYDAVPVDNIINVDHHGFYNEDDNDQVPWWKRRRNVLSFAMCLVIVCLAVVVGVLLGGQQQQQQSKSPDVVLVDSGNDDEGGKLDNSSNSTTDSDLTTGNSEASGDTPTSPTPAPTTPVSLFTEIPPLYETTVATSSPTSSPTQQPQKSPSNSPTLRPTSVPTIQPQEPPSASPVIPAPCISNITYNKALFDLYYDQSQPALAMAGNTAIISRGQMLYVYDLSSSTMQEMISDAGELSRTPQVLGITENQNTVFVGSPQVNDNTGAVYVFRRRYNNPNEWSKDMPFVEELEQRVDTPIYPTNLEYGAHFGYAMDMNRDLLVVGSPYEKYVYLYRRDENKWNEEAKLGRSSSSNLEYFGKSVAVARKKGNGGNKIAVAGKERSFSGSVYLYEFDTLFNDWVLTYILINEECDGGYNEELGTTLAFTQDDGLLVGCPDPGVILYYAQNPNGKRGDYILMQNITTSRGDRIGYEGQVAVSDDGNVMVAGTFERKNFVVFTKEGSVWSETMTIDAPGGSNDFMRVDISGSHVLIATDENVYSYTIYEC